MRASDRISALGLGAAVLVGLLSQTVSAQTSDPGVAPRKHQRPQSDGDDSALPGDSDQQSPLVADVIIIGSNHIPVDQLMARIKTKPGKKYSKSDEQDDIRTLMLTKQFGNIVSSTRQEPDGRITVYFTIRDYPSLIEEVVYQGNKHMSKDDLDKLTGLRKGQPLNPMANKQACESIVRKLNEDGRPFACCTLLSGDKPSDTKIIFNITEGYKMNLRSVYFNGNQWATSGRLMAQIQTKPILNGVLPTKYNPDAIAADIEKIKEYYENFGFLDVKIQHGLEMTEDGRDVIITYYINEGQRFTYGHEPRIENNKFVPYEQLAQLSGVKAGEFYSKPIVDGDVTKFQDYIGYTGRNAIVQMRQVYSEDTPGVVDIVYNVDERPPARVGQIIIVGNERTKQNVILRQLPLYPGQLLTYPDLRVAERNLQRINIFNTSQDGSIKPTVTILDKDGPNPTKDILVQVEEANTGSLVFGVGVNSNSGLTGSIVLNERNFDIQRPPTSFEDLISGDAWRGAGQQFQINAMPGTQIQRYSVSWTEPYLFETPNSLGLSGYYYTRIYNEYDEQRLGFRPTLSRRLTQNWTVTGGLRVEDIEINGVVDFAPPQISQYVGDNFLAGARASTTFDTRDSYLRPTSGSIFDIGIEQCFGSYTFPVATASFNQYFTLWQRPDGSGRHVLAFRSMVGWAGNDTPVFERFYAGGLGSIRGFQFRGVSPDINGFKIGGDFLFINSVEYQIPVLSNDQFFMVAFCDSGTVEEKVEIGTYRVSAGFGFRFVVPMLGPAPIALDFGFPLVKASTDITQVFSFSMGFTH